MELRDFKKYFPDGFGKYLTDEEKGYLGNYVDLILKWGIPTNLPRSDLSGSYQYYKVWSIYQKLTYKEISYYYFRYSGMNELVCERVLDLLYGYAFYTPEQSMEDNIDRPRPMMKKRSLDELLREIKR